MLTPATREAGRSPDISARRGPFDDARCIVACTIPYSRRHALTIGRLMGKLIAYPGKDAERLMTLALTGEHPETPMFFKAMKGTGVPSFSSLKNHQKKMA
jgi:hypothetical protein